VAGGLALAGAMEPGLMERGGLSVVPISTLGRPGPDAATLDGALRFSVVAVILLLMSGAGLMAVWTRRNLAERRRLLQAELEQGRLATRLGLVMRYANDVIMILDEQLCVVEISDRAVELYGCPREQLLHRSIRDFRAPEALPQLDQDLAKMRRPGGAVFETLHRGKGGRPIPVEISERMVEIDGRPHLLAVIRDITERRLAERALRESEERHRLIAENTFDMIWLGDLATGKFTYVSPASRRVHGLAPEQLVGRPMMDFLTPAAQRRAAALLPGRVEAFNAGDAQARHHIDELEVVRPDGAVLQIEVVTTFMPDAAGRAATLLGITRDITERKQTERALRESEERYRLITENTSDAIWLYELGPQRFSYLSPAAERMFGYSREDQQGRDLLSYLSPASAAEADRSLRERLTAIAAGDESARHRTSQYEIVRRDGTTIMGEVVTNLLCDATGWPVQLLGVTRDITERVQSEARLLESEARYRRLFERNPVPMLIYERGSLRLLAVNEAFEAHYGYGRDEALALLLTDLYPPEERGPVTELARRLHGHADAGEWHHLKRDGTVITIVAHSHDLDYGGREARVAVVTDITERKRAELALQESQARFRLIAENSGDIIWLYDLQARKYRYVSPVVEKVLGYTTQEVGASLLTDLLTPASRATTLSQIEAQVAAFVAGDESARTRIYDVEFVCKDGDIRQAEVSASLMADAGGRALMMVGTTRDVTQRRRIEAALRESEHTLAAVFDSADMGILFADVEGRLQRVNARFCSMLGYTGAELLALDQQAYSHPDEHQRHLALLGKIRDGSSDGFQLEKRFIRKDGGCIWVHLGVSAVRNGDSTLRGFVTVVDDITERRRAREALKQFSAELELRVEARTAELGARTREIEGLLDSIPDAVLLCIGDGKPIFSHLPRKEELPPFLAEDASLDALRENPFVKEIAGTMRELTHDGPQTVVREFDREVDGAICSVEARATPIGIDQVLILLRDITARRRAEREVLANLARERQLSELKSQFISVASHEFRTPLAAAVGSLELLQRHSDRMGEEKRVELLSRMQRSLGRLTAIMTDVLTISRVDAGRVVVKTMPLELGRFVQDVVREVEDGDRQQHRFSFVQTGGPDVVTTDSNLLHHILSNLVGNAVRYSKAETTVSVALEHTERAFAVTVADEGIGVPEAEQARIFEPFVRGSNVGQIGGTGLGLNIVKRYAELLGGRVELLPSARGATFRVVIPREYAAKPSPNHNTGAS
jgi:PAS domain S-box-containing protein